MKVSNRMLLMGTMLIFAGSIHSMAPQVRRKLKREIEAGIKDIRTASLDENIEQKVEAIRKKINRFATPYKRQADRYTKELNDVLARRPIIRKIEAVERKAVAVEEVKIVPALEVKEAPKLKAKTEQQRITQELERLLAMDISPASLTAAQYQDWVGQTSRLRNRLRKINEKLARNYTDRINKKTAPIRGVE